jgi:hypothetical protein
VLPAAHFLLYVRYNEKEGLSKIQLCGLHQPLLSFCLPKKKVTKKKGTSKSMAPPI